MNGDAQIIMNKIVEIETKQEERHIENKEDLRVIFKKLGKLDKLPCEVHIERMKWFKASILGLWGVMAASIIGAAGVWIKHMMAGG